MRRCGAALLQRHNLHRKRLHLQHDHANVRIMRRGNRAILLRHERLADSEQQQLLLQPHQPCLLQRRRHKRVMHALRGSR
jgi:hypothetical protein